MRFIAFLMLMVMPLAVFAAPPATSSHADKIFTLTVEDPAIKAQIKAEIAHSINKSIGKMPCAASLKPEVEQFTNRIVDSKLRPMVTQLLTEQFTGKELIDIENFLSSATGRKMISSFPQISDRANQVVMQAAIENAGEIAELLAKHINSDGSCK